MVCFTVDMPFLPVYSGSSDELLGQKTFLCTFHLGILKDDEQSGRMGISEASHDLWLMSPKHVSVDALRFFVFGVRASSRT